MRLNTKLINFFEKLANKLAQHTRGVFQSLKITRVLKNSIQSVQSLLSKLFEIIEFRTETYLKGVGWK